MAPHEATSNELVRLITNLKNKIGQKDYAGLDSALRATSVAELSTVELLAISRTTFIVRSKLREWQAFVDRAKSEVDSRGQNGALAFKGLLD